MLDNNIGASTIDRSIGFLFFAIAATAFVLLTVIGMGKVQQNAEDATDVSRRNRVEVTSDIGN